MSDESRQPGTSQGPPDPATRRLAASLLGPQSIPCSEASPRWAYTRWGRALVSLFIAYHVAVVIVHNLPTGGLTAGLSHFSQRRLRASNYLDATGSTQSWPMFAPNPALENVFIRVLVEDREGELHDLQHDIYGRREYPYLFYSHMSKINRRLAQRRTHRLSYGAWVCREWERDHAGVPARSVRLVRLSSRVPPPQAAAAEGEFDPLQLPLARKELETIDCSKAIHAQLPPRLRERYGFEPVPGGVFRKAVIRTWVDARRRAPSSRSARPGGERQSP